jgi:hypothetical protein
MGWIALAVLLVTVRPALADTACGDAGHYLEGSGRVLLNNPDGRAFSLELHRFQWWIGGGWDQRESNATVTWGLLPQDLTRSFSCGRARTPSPTAPER